MHRALPETALQRAIAGRYAIERELGRGGMGVVYLARDVALERPVAIKVLPPELATATIHERFLREARTAAGLSHPHIVPIHTVEAHDGLVFFVMAFVDGETLRERVTRVGPLAPAEAARIMQEVAWALAHAHDRGVIHRDVKPDNVLIEHDSGRVLVTDFGIAHTARDEALTEEGSFLGTPSFASPEQAAGTTVDGRSDIYSLGATLFYALTGRPVFDDPSVQEILVKHLTEPAPAIGAVRPDLPRPLAQAVDRCLGKSPTQRFASAEDLAVALGAARAAAPEIPRALIRLAQEADRLALDLATAIGMGFSALIAWTLGPRGSEGFAALVYAYVFVALAFGGGLILARFGEYVFDTRITLLRGYGERHIRDVLLGTTGHPFGAPGPRKLSLRRMVYFGATSAATLTCWLFTWGAWRYPHPSLEWLIDWVSVAGPVVMARSAAILIVARRGRAATWWRRVLAGRMGRWVLWLAASRLPRRPPGVAAGPTEAVLLEAAGSIFRQLPASQRELLRDLPDLMARLEHHAKALRARQADLEQALAQSSRRPVGDSGGEPRALVAALQERADAAYASLEQAYQAATARLGNVVAALENIRLGLLRLRAGVAGPEDITADLDLASQLAQEVDDVLRGGTNVAETLPRDR